MSDEMPRARDRTRTIAVALHGIEPASFERCAVIRDWLDDHGVDRVTLLVIPARDLHPVGERAPAMVEWLGERRIAGDAIAQHGFQHAGCGRHRHGEFVGLDGAETRRAVHAGWRVLKLAGIEPDGFVAPAYAYTDALHETLAQRFRWWAGLLRLHRPPSLAGPGPRGPLSPAWSLTATGPVNRLLSPSLLTAAGMLPLASLRLDLHPADLARPRHMMALERVLERAQTRRAVTYQELAAGA
jgi:Uncharacterized protein conserved in bacteria (DUF2334)